MYQSLKERGRSAADYYAGKDEYFTLSPASLSLLRGLIPVLQGHCRGRVLDAGAGRGAYRKLLLQYADCYVGVDIGCSAAISTVGDVQRLPFADNSFDTVFCSQVLEHVAEPWLALAEFRRVLRPGGKLVLSVPHMSWLHNEPHDYYRYTPHGLKFLLDRAALKTNTIVAAGGLLSLLGHIFSTCIVNYTYGLPLIHSVCVRINRLLVGGFAFADRSIEKSKIFALNYIVLAECQK